MHRKKFLQAGLCCGAFAALAEAAPEAAKPKGTPCDERMEFSERWIVRFMQALDETVDAGTRQKLMVLNGHRCFEGAHGKAPEKMEDTLDQFLAKCNSIAPGSASRNGDVVQYKYIGNSKSGVTVKDGFCLCPLTERVPKGITPTYCHCSVGYVAEMFHRISGGKKVSVELTRSLLRGDKECSFRIQLGAV